MIGYTRHGCSDPASQGSPAAFADPSQGDLDLFLSTSLISIVSFRPGRKSRHRAGLNLGDCFSYALAQSLAQPLLFKADDFCHTDLQPACPVT